MSSKDPVKCRKLTDLVSADALDLLAASGTKLVEKIGIEIVRGVVLDVLTGKNLRDSTEALTRKRIGTLNLALLQMFLSGTSNNSSFGSELLGFACKRLTETRITKEERWLAQWVLGLTDKGFQNVLRDEHNAIINYTSEYKNICHRIVDRIGKNSRIEKLARKVGGAIVQMSMSYWPREVARELNKALGYSHEVLKLSDEKFENYFRRQIAKVPMEKIIGLSG